MAMKTVFKREFCCSRYQKALQFIAMVVGKWGVRGRTWQQSQKAIISESTTRFTSGFPKLQVFLVVFFLLGCGCDDFFREWVKILSEHLDSLFDFLIKL